MHRQLAEANPAAYAPDLAGSLNNLGIRLAEAGRREEALGAAQEAVTLHRQLAEANPAAYAPDLARSLNNLGIRLAEAGRREEALGPRRRRSPCTGSWRRPTRLPMPPTSRRR